MASESETFDIALKCGSKLLAHLRIQLRDARFDQIGKKQMGKQRKFPRIPASLVEVTGTGAILVQLSWFVMPCCPDRFRPRTKPVPRGMRKNFFSSCSVL
jgi:hypothetical protein